MKYVCTTICEESSSVWTWQKACIPICSIPTSVSNTNHSIIAAAWYDYFQGVTRWICQNCHPGTVQNWYNGNEFEFIVKDHSPKLWRSVLVTKTIISHIASLYINILIITYGITMPTFTDCQRQLVSKLFNTLCISLKTKKTNTMAYSLKTNRQQGLFHEDMITIPRHDC